MDSTLAEPRLRLFAFTQAEGKHRYLAILRAFDDARERSQLQLAPSDLLETVDALESVEAALVSLDQLFAWGLLARVQDDRRVRTIAEYKQRRSVYQMTELGWVAWKAVEEVLAATPGEAELRRLVLQRVLDDLNALAMALESEDGERVAELLDALHRTLEDLAQHAARFTLATSELAATWEAAPETFLQHKGRLLGHLDGFLAALSSRRGPLGAAVEQLDGHRERLLDLAAAHGGVLDGRSEARRRAELRWEGVVAWFADRPGRPSQASMLEERTSRAIRDLAVLLKRVFDANAGGVSRATQLEDLAAALVACPDDATAHALVNATSGLRSARHFGVPLSGDLDAGLSWWDAPPAAIDTTLRKRGRASPAAPPKPIPDRRLEQNVVRQRLLAQRDASAQAGRELVQALELTRPLREAELQVLLRLLARALHSRGPEATVAHTVHGRLRLTLSPSDRDTTVPTERGTLVLPKHALRVEAAGEQP